MTCIYFNSKLCIYFNSKFFTWLVYHGIKIYSLISLTTTQRLTKYNLTRKNRPRPLPILKIVTTEHIENRWLMGEMYFLICCEIPYWNSLSQTEILLGITHWFLLGTILQIVESAKYPQKCQMNNKEASKKLLCSHEGTWQVNWLPFVAGLLCTWIRCINSHLRIKCLRSLMIMKVSYSTLQGSFTEIKGLHR